MRIVGETTFVSGRPKELRLDEQDERRSVLDILNRKVLNSLITSPASVAGLNHLGPTTTSGLCVG